jgi:hypothetical protein
MWGDKIKHMEKIPTAASRLPLVAIKNCSRAFVATVSPTKGLMLVILSVISAELRCMAVMDSMEAMGYRIIVFDVSHNVGANWCNLNVFTRTFFFLKDLNFLRFFEI